MAKNITIMKNKVTQTYTSVKKIRTNLVGEGTQNWVPEDEAADYAKIKNGSFNKNDTYYASEQNYDAYKEVKVRVPDAKLKLKGLNATQNGVYTAESMNCDAFNNVSVKVAGGGTGGGDYTFEWELVVADSVSNSARTIAVLNNKVYIVDGYCNIHCFDGTNWSTLPAKPANPNTGQGGIISLCTYNNQLHFLWAYQHSVFNGSTWDELPTRNPVFFGATNCIEYNGVLHAIGGGYNAAYTAYHHVWDGNSWTRLADLPFRTRDGALVEYNGELHAISMYNADAGGYKHLVYNGSGWTEAAMYGNDDASAVVVKINGMERIHWCCGDDGMGSYHLSYDGLLPQWRPEESPNIIGSFSMVMLNDTLYAISQTTDYKTYKAKIITEGNTNA